MNINGQEYTLIHSLAQLDALDGYNAVTGSGTIQEVGGYYALANNLDGSGIVYLDSLFSARIGNIYAGTIDEGGFTGHFLGLGNAINNLTINSTQNFASLLGKTMKNSVVRDLGLTNVNITGSAALAGLNYADLYQVYVTGNVTGTGALIGNNQSAQDNGDYFNSIRNCFSTANGASRGGLIANSWNANIYSSHATGNIEGYSGQMGGLIGVMKDTSIYDSYASGKVTSSGNGDSVGGLVGSMHLYDVDGHGQQYSFIIENVYATGNVTSNGAPQNYPGQIEGVGGLIGKPNVNYGKGGIYVKDSFATGNVTYNNVGSADHNEGVGGLIGNAFEHLQVDNCYAIGNVSNSNSAGNTGGLVGRVGSNKVTINNSYATGNVIGGGYRTGGLVGMNVGGLINNSYATGNVTGGMYAGGLVGQNSGTVNGSYASGAVSGQPAGGLVGSNNGSISNSYYNSEVNSELGIIDSGSGSVNNSGGLTTEQMADVQYYLDGTIEQVLAARAAEAARQAAEEAAQAAARQTAAQQAAGGTQAGISNQASQTKTDTLQNQVDRLGPDNLWQLSADGQNASADTGSYSAHIKAVQADGVEYQLEDNSSNGEDDRLLLLEKIREISFTVAV